MIPQSFGGVAAAERQTGEPRPTSI